MKKITIIALLMSVFTLSAFAKGKQPIAFEKVPQVVQTEFKKSFTTDQVQYVTTKKELGHRDYTFTLADGTKIKFDQKGRLRQVENKAGILTTLVPEKILEYARQTFPNAIITEYKCEKSRQEIELNDNMELIFSKRSKFLRIED